MDSRLTPPCPTAPMPAWLTARRERWLPWLAALLYFLIGFPQLSFIGVPYDDPAHASYGELVLKAFQTGGQDRRNESFRNLYFYGAWVDSLAALSYGGEDGKRSYFLRHVLFLAFGGLALPGVYLLARRVGGWQAALPALIVAATMPRLLGHSLMNNKDIPFATILVWSFCWVWGIRGQSWRLGSREALGLGLLAGLGMACRVGGIMIFVILGIAAAAGWWRDLISGERLRLSFFRETLISLGWWLVALILAWCIMVAPWPWAWHDPIGNPFQALREFANFSHFPWIFYEGELLNAGALPWHYLLAHLLLGTPVPWLLLAALGMGYLLCLTLRRLPSRLEPEAKTVLGVGLWAWLGFPILFVLLTSPVLYGAGRQFLFLLYAMAVAAGCGFALLCRYFPARRTWFWSGLAVCAAWAIWGAVSFFPYHYVYYNEFAGERKGLAERYEMDDWVMSYRPAAEWLNERQKEQADRGQRVLFYGSIHCRDSLVTFLDPRILSRDFVLDSFGRVDEAALQPRLPEGVDYFLTVVDPTGIRMFAEEPIVHEIKAGPTVVAFIRKREELPKP